MTGDKEQDKQGKSGTPERTWQSLYGQVGVVQPTPSGEVFEAMAAFRSSGVRKVLDLGSGTGRHTRVLLQNGFVVHGCDASHAAVEIASRDLPDAPFHVALMTDLPYEENLFDAVFCYQVIQHARTSEVLLAVGEIKRVLRQDGVLYLRVPSTEHPEARTGREIEEGTRLGIDAIDGDVPHHYFTGAELESLFGDFEILSLVHRHHASEKDPSRPAASWSLLARTRPGSGGAS